MIRNRVEDFNATKQSPRLGQDALFLEQIHISLQKPLFERCEDVRRMINEFSIKDLHVLYPHLLASIFSTVPTKGWALHTPHSRSLEAFRRFLGPHGPVWSLVEKLDRDSFLRYEFPVTCLPRPTQRLFAEGIIPAMYFNKVQVNGENRTPLVVLGAVEYFLYQFAYFITQSVTPWDTARSAERGHDTIYSALLTDYLEHFLPTLISVRLPENRSPHPKFPARRYHNHVGDSTPPQFSGLIKSFENKHAVTSTVPGPDHFPMHARQSELFIQIFIEFWMNHGEDREGTQSFSPFGQDYFLPSVDHVRVVRILVKHLHHFMNVNMNNHPAVTSSSEMDEAFYRSFMPESTKLFKRRLYWFIHHCFAHWPLDPTFRFILETWLSYIQPWRYANSEQSPPNRNVDRGMLFWKPFIHRNLLFYTVILQEFLNRAEKLNLRSAKDSQLFYRVTKVFFQEHLMYIVNEAEGELLTCLSSVQTAFVQKPRSPKPEQYLHFMELQIPGTVYKPLWMEETIRNVRHLLHRVDDTLRSLREPQATNEGREPHGGWFASKARSVLNWLQDVFAIDEQYWLIQDESHKTKEHLTQISRNLRKIFQIEDDAHETTIPWAADVCTTSHAQPQGSSNSVETLPDCTRTDRGLQLTALGKYQIANGLRRFDIQYSGDPDLQPVRSFEIVFLVRACHKLSTFLNHKFASRLSTIYALPGWRGSLARYLSPGVQQPRTLSPVKHEPASGETSGQPKISLRFLASYRLWAQLMFVYCFLSFVLGRPWLAVFVVVFVLMYMFVSSIHAVKTGHGRSRTNSETLHWDCD